MILSKDSLQMLTRVSELEWEDKAQHKGVKIKAAVVVDF